MKFSIIGSYETGYSVVDETGAVVKGHGDYDFHEDALAAIKDLTDENLGHETYTDEEGTLRYVETDEEYEGDEGGEIGPDGRDGYGFIHDIGDDEEV